MTPAIPPDFVVRDAMGPGRWHREELRLGDDVVGARGERGANGGRVSLMDLECCVSKA